MVPDLSHMPWITSRSKSTPVSLATQWAAGIDADHYAGAMSPEEISQNRQPEVDPEDLRKYDGAALRLAHDLAHGESARWADLVNTAASMGEIEEQDQ